MLCVICRFMVQMVIWSYSNLPRIETPLLSTFLPLLACPLVEGTDASHAFMLLAKNLCPF